MTLKYDRTFYDGVRETAKETSSTGQPDDSKAAHGITTSTPRHASVRSSDTNQGTELRHDHERESESGRNRTMASETAHAAAREIGSALKRLSVYNQEADLKLSMLRSETVALELSGVGRSQAAPASLFLPGRCGPSVPSSRAPQLAADNWGWAILQWFARIGSRGVSQ